MLRKSVRFSSDIKPVDFVFFWRDTHRRIGSAKVIRIDGNIVTLIHDGCTKNSSLNRVCKTEPPIKSIEVLCADHSSSAISETMRVGNERSTSQEADETKKYPASTDACPKRGPGRPRKENKNAGSFVQEKHPRATRMI